jgi:pyruvate ferredoxin oxidoreductase delta subunit
VSGTSGDEISMSRPSVGEAGRTGDWRNSRPVMDAAKCLAVKQGKLTCQICWVYCPDGCIARGVGPVIDLDYCKGCGICAQECPAGAISMEPEGEHGTCAIDAVEEASR